MKVLVAAESREEREEIVRVLVGLDEVSVQGAVPDLGHAVRALAEAPPDLLITGLRLTGGSGIELIEQARRVSPASHIVVVAPAPTRDVWLRHLAAGADRFVAREPGFTELTEIVNDYVERAGHGDGEDQLRLLGRMAAGVVHDLNNYLGAADAMLAMIERTPADSTPLSRARGSLELAARLTARLLGYVRHSSAALEAIDFGELVRSIVMVVSSSLSPKIDVHVDVAPRLRLVQGVRAELEQLVLNLVLNAADAMADGGELVVRAQPTGTSAVYLEVSDTGDGISDTTVAAGGDLTPSSKPGRERGLGLGIARRVAARHGSTIVFTRREDRSGTVAKTFLPAI